MKNFTELEHLVWERNMNPSIVLPPKRYAPTTLGAESVSTHSMLNQSEELGEDGLM